MQHFKWWGVPPEVLAHLEAQLLAPIAYDATAEMPNPPTTENYLDALESYTLLCSNEADYFRRALAERREPLSVEEINRRVAFHFENRLKIENGPRTNGGPVKLSNGSRVQGTTHRPGGLQPRYIIDSRSAEIRTVLDRSAEISRSHLTALGKIRAIGNYLRTEVFEATAYDDPLYRELLQRYRELGLEIPLSEYLKIRRAVCREIAMVTQLAYEAAGLDSYYYYLKVQTQFEDENSIEDHAINLVKLEGEIWSFDNYFRQFNARRLDALESGIETEVGSMYAPPRGRGRAKLLFPRTYPEVATHPKHVP